MIENTEPSQSAIIAASAVSSSIVLILLFSAIICGHHFIKKHMESDKTSDSKSNNSQSEPNPLYEDILPRFLSQDLEMQQNTAYGSAKPCSSY